MRKEPSRDPQLAEALNRLEGGPPIDAVDWDRLQGAISAQARLPLVRLRRAISWWDYTARWAGAAVPLAAAAILVIVATLPSVLNSDAPMQGNSPGASLLEREGLAQAVAGDIPERDVFEAVVGPTDGEWLRDGAMEGGEQ